MVSCDVTSCTEEPLWQVVVPGISAPLSRSDKVGVVYVPPGSKIIPPSDLSIGPTLHFFISYSYNSSAAVMKCCVKTIPENGSSLLLSSQRLITTTSALCDIDFL